MKPTRFSTLAYLAFITSYSTASMAAGSCEQSEIDHYLDRGFTPAQVVNLCGNAAPVIPTQPSASNETVKQQPVESQTSAPPTFVASPSQTSTPGNRPPALSEEEWYEVKNAIDADDVVFENDALVYTRDRCHKFGQEDFGGFKEKACVITRTHINSKGLKILNAQTGIVLIRDPELLVSGDIKREVLNAEKLKPAVRKGFLAEYATAPDALNVPVKRGFEPPKIARLLEKLAH
ncbi:MAG: hypothetical protein ACWA5X_04420 [bacterium]